MAALSQSDNLDDDIPCISSIDFYEKQNNLAELSESYANYMKVDISKERKTVEEATDELLTKLEEFMSLVDLIRSDDSICFTAILPRIRKKYDELEKIFERIDKLEVFVNVVKQNLGVLEAKISIAEKHLIPENSFSKLLRPLFSKKDSSPKSPGPVEPYQPPEIFHTSHYITSLESDHTGESSETSGLEKT